MQKNVFKITIILSFPRFVKLRLYNIISIKILKKQSLWRRYNDLIMNKFLILLILNVILLYITYVNNSIAFWINANSNSEKLSEDLFKQIAEKQAKKSVLFYLKGTKLFGLILGEKY